MSYEEFKGVLYASLTHTTKRLNVKYEKADEKTNTLTLAMVYDFLERLEIVAGWDEKV